MSSRCAIFRREKCPAAVERTTERTNVFEKTSARRWTTDVPRIARNSRFGQRA